MKTMTIMLIAIYAFSHIQSSAAVVGDGSGAALLSIITSLEADNFERFMDEERSEEDEKALERQFDAMLEHMKALDRETLLDFVDRAFENGWPSHTIAFMFGEAMAMSFGGQMQDFLQTMAFIETGKPTQARKVFAIQFAQRKWMKLWSDEEYAQFVPIMSAFVLDGSNNFDLRMSVADDFARTLPARLRGGNVNETTRNIAVGVLDLALKMLRNKDEERWLPSLTRHAISLYGAVRGKPQLSAASDDSWRRAVVRILKDGATHASIVEGILHAQETLLLADLLSADDVARMKADKRFSSSECQKALGLIQQKIDARTADAAKAKPRAIKLNAVPAPLQPAPNAQKR